MTRIVAAAVIVISVAQPFSAAPVVIVVARPAPNAITYNNDIAPLIGSLRDVPSRRRLGAVCARHLRRRRAARGADATVTEPLHAAVKADRPRPLP
jgi:hypothetical protein